jgi:hypothetical protein
MQTRKVELKIDADASHQAAVAIRELGEVLNSLPDDVKAGLRSVHLKEGKADANS